MAQYMTPEVHRLQFSGLQNQPPLPISAVLSSVIEIRLKPRQRLLLNTLCQSLSFVFPNPEEFPFGGKFNHFQEGKWKHQVSITKLMKEILLCWIYIEL